MAHNDGGSAFPSTVRCNDGSLDYNPGISPRDYFAAMALQGILASEVQGDGLYQPPGQERGSFLQANAHYAYEWADAMLAEREKTK